MGNKVKQGGRSLPSIVRSHARFAQHHYNGVPTPSRNRWRSGHSCAHECYRTPSWGLALPLELVSKAGPAAEAGINDGLHMFFSPLSRFLSTTSTVWWLFVGLMRWSQDMARRHSAWGVYICRSEATTCPRTMSILARGSVRRNRIQLGRRIWSVRAFWQ